MPSGRLLAQKSRASDPPQVVTLPLAGSFLLLDSSHPGPWNKAVKNLCGNSGKKLRHRRQKAITEQQNLKAITRRQIPSPHRSSDAMPQVHKLIVFPPKQYAAAKILLTALRRKPFPGHGAAPRKLTQT